MRMSLWHQSRVICPPTLGEGRNGHQPMKGIRAIALGDKGVFVGRMPTRSNLFTERVQYRLLQPKPRIGAGYERIDGATTMFVTFSTRFYSRLRLESADGNAESYTY